MTISASADTSPSPSPVSPAVPAPPSWRWRRSALLLAIAAQLITISALVGADPPTRSWPSLLLAIAPAPVAAAAAFAPRPMRLPAAACGSAVLAAGIAGAWQHTGLFFGPALLALAAGAARLWRERS
jgi:hypothetical protein